MKLNGVAMTVLANTMADGSQIQLPLRRELVVDLFAGGGGASTGLAAAYREPVPTLTAGGGHVGEVRAFLIKYYGTDGDVSMREPLHTVTKTDQVRLIGNSVCPPVAQAIARANLAGLIAIYSEVA